MYFGNYGFRKTLLDKCLKSRVSEDSSTSNMVNGIKQCWNLKWHHFCHIFWALCWQLISKNSLIVIGKISGLFFNTLTAGQKYSLLNRDNLAPPTQMQLSLKAKTFSQFFSAFSKWRLKVEDFRKKDEAHSRCILEVTESENSG